MHGGGSRCHMLPTEAQALFANKFRVAVVKDSRIFRHACFTGALILIISVFWVGSKPVAVGLFTGQMDKVAHFATFGLIASLLWLSLLHVRPLWVIAIVSTVGAADEFHQRFLPGRSASIEDLAVDVFSVVVIVSLLEYVRRRED